MCVNKTWPKISIVTPSYDQGQYLEETILSVIGQNYPNLEYIIIDGGSTDNSVEIIKKYERYLAYWVSEKDNGQSKAINKGFRRATGSILGWLNSDDIYLPGALYNVASNLDITKPELIFGNCFHFVEGEAQSWGSNVKREYEESSIFLRDYIIQPSSFWTKKAWVKTGILEDKLNYAFDWDWFIRAKQNKVIFKPQNKYLSIYRIHKSHKTSTGTDKRFNELALIYRKYKGIKYERMLRDCYNRRLMIGLIKRWVCRLKLYRFEAEIFKLMFPNLFLGYKKNEIKDTLHLI